MSAVADPVVRRPEQLSPGHLWKLGKKLGIAAKKLEAEENAVYDARHEITSKSAFSLFSFCCFAAPMPIDSRNSPVAIH